MKYIDKEALIEMFKLYVYAMYPDDKLPFEHRKKTAKKAFKDFAQKIQESNNNPQAYLTATTRHEDIAEEFASFLKSRFNKSFKTEIIVKKELKDEYPIAEATTMMGYRDQETIKKKIDNKEIIARDANPTGIKRKYYISIEEIEKHKRKKKKK